MTNEEAVNGVAEILVREGMGRFQARVTADRILDELGWWIERAGMNYWTR